jgi:type III restriction enzyme
MPSSTGPVVNPGALEPLFAPSEAPAWHRVRATRKGDPAQVVKGRRPSPILLAQNLRQAVADWRQSFYAGASHTTRTLLHHWFERSHRQVFPDGTEQEFRYYFCQREAIETLVYLKEVRRLTTLSAVVEEFGGADRELAALGIPEEEDRWSRYAFKIATGAGKTKVMSLAIVWSYFHALRESDSELARHFLVVAPNLTVFERLKEDFGDGLIFRRDPLIPIEWLGDWNFSVVLQDEAGGAATGGVLYLTNIHRLYDPGKRRKREEKETYAWLGPPVQRSKALDTSEALRERITQHRLLMVLNDEAHHLWDPGSAWNEALQYLQDTIQKRTGGGLVAQLDFSATPKDNRGQVFKHVVVDTPLGEAVDAGIVKTPIIGRSSQDLTERPDTNAAYQYEQHLLLGYQRWKKSLEEWEESGRRPLLFVMTQDTRAADEIANRLSTDPLFEALNGKTLNLHTRLKGKVKKVGRGAQARYEFIEAEGEISADDLEVLRRLSRELDEGSSPHRCIVSVLMLREGWDVRNVTTIVPLRPYTSKANILPEQTLGRGLRRMTPPGEALEVVVVVEHRAFASLYQQELAQEGLPIEIVDLEHVPKTTVSIFPDPKKNWDSLDIAIPRLSPSYSTRHELPGLTIEAVRQRFVRYQSLRLGQPEAREIDYEGRALLTDEIVEAMRVNLPLLESGVGAISFFVKELEHVCRLRGLHGQLAPLLETFLTEMLFAEKIDLWDARLVARLSDADVREHVRAVFVPLLRQHSTEVRERTPEAPPEGLRNWKSFQVTHSERQPVLPARCTLFNLVPCNRQLEVAMAQFLDRAEDVAAFAKNAGPQKLLIDYLAQGQRLAFYHPDFFARCLDGTRYLIETKGRADVDTGRKAKAAIAWCEAASSRRQRWEYLYVPQAAFEALSATNVAALARRCEPALRDLLAEEGPQIVLPFGDDAAPPSDLIPGLDLSQLPSRYRSAVEQAMVLQGFLERKANANFAPVFTPLLGCLDEAARGLILRRLEPSLPAAAPEQRTWFEPYLGGLERRLEAHYRQVSQNLKRTLVFRNGLSPLGLLRNCLDHAVHDAFELGGVYRAVKSLFRRQGAEDLLALVGEVNLARNTFVAHQEKELTDPAAAKAMLQRWVQALVRIAGEPA